MSEGNSMQNNLEALQVKVSSFASGIDDSLAERFETIRASQEKQLQEIRRDVLIKKTVFEVETKRALHGADEKALLALAKIYNDLDLGDEHD